MRRNFWSLCLPLLDTPGAGSGGGGSAGAGGQQGSGGTGAGGQQGAGAGGQPGAGQGGTGAGSGGAPYRLNDDSLVDFGDGKPVKWSDARSQRYVDRSEYDDYVQRWNKGVEFLTNVAKTYDARGGQPQRGQQQQRVQAQRQGIDFDELAQQPVVDGATVARMARELQSTQLAPLGQALAQIAARLQQQEQTLEGLRGTAGTLAEEHSTKEFDGLFTKTIKSLPEIKGLKGAIPLDDPAIRDLFDDTYLSHDQKDPTLRREITAMVAKRLEGIVALVRKMDQANAEEAIKNRRRFPAMQRGTGQGSGQGGYQYQTGSELARNFFGSAPQNT